MKINKEQLNKRLFQIIIFLFFFVLLFIKTEGKTTYQGEVFVKYISGKKSELILLIGFFGLIIYFAQKILKKGKINNISALLFLRFILFVIFNIIIYLFHLCDTSFQQGIVLAYFLSFCFFNIGICNENKKFISKMCFASIIIITVQLIITFFGRSLNYSEALKWWMVIPIGQTNTIGCYLIGMLMYVNSANDEKKVKIIAAILTLLSIILTYSRSGLLMYLLYVIYLMGKDLKSNNRSGKMKAFLIICIILCTIGIIIVNKINVFNRFSFDSLTNSRFKVYKEGIELFTNHIFIGVGAYSYHIYDAVKAHNWILETLIENGIFGSFLYFIIIKKVYCNIKKISPYMIPFFMFYLIHGLVEPNLYTATFDSFFWLLIGSCLYKKEIKNTN